MFQRGIATTLKGRQNIRAAFKTTSFAFHGTTALCAPCSTVRVLTTYSNKHASSNVSGYTAQFKYAEQVQSQNAVLHNDVHPCGRTYTVQNLLTQPLHTAASLGQPLPTSPHAISTSLPTWQHVHGYEQADPAVVNQLFCGYPRFCIHPYTKQLFEQVAAQYGDDLYDTAYVFPNAQSADRCITFIHKHLGNSTAIKAQPLSNAGQCTAVLFNESVRKTVHQYWQHTGETVSSRQAHSILENRWLPIDTTVYSTLKQRIASHTTGSSDDVFLLSSGMHALSTAMRFAQSLKPNSNTIQVGFPYLDTLKLQTIVGSGAHYFNSGDAAELQQIEQLLAAGDIAAVFTELPTNPLLRCIDLPALHKLCRTYNTPLIVDDTIASFVSVNSIEHCDISVCSLSKWYSGAGDILAGCAIVNNNSTFYAQYKQFMSAEQSDVLYRCDAEVLEFNARDVVQRVHASIHNANVLSAYLQSHPLVSTVNVACTDVAGIQKLPHGISGMFSLTLAGGERAAQVFYDSLRTCKGPGLGTNFTLVCPYTLLAHYNELDWCASLGISSNLIRVSCGQEDAADLLQRFADALTAVERAVAPQQDNVRTQRYAKH